MFTLFSMVRKQWWLANQRKRRPEPKQIEALEERAAPALDGTLNLAFGTNGIAPNPGQSTVMLNGVRQITVAPDGDIVAIGIVSGEELNRRFAEVEGVARFTATGQPDVAFGLNGITPIARAFQGGSHSLDTVAVQADGKILVRGLSVPVTAQSPRPVIDFLIRLNPDGSFDQTFGTSGEVVIAEETSSSARGLAVQSSGRILLSLQSVNGNIGLLALTSTGALDTTFGNNGRVVTQIPGAAGAGPTTLLVAADDTIYQQGWSNGAANVSGQTTYVVHYDVNGTPSAEFGGAGTGVALVPEAGNPPNRVFFDQHMAVGRDGKVLLAGIGFNLTPLTYLVRLNADGSRDASFGGADGFVTVTGAGGKPAVQADGKIVLSSVREQVGIVTSSGVTRLNVDGNLDTSFGTANGFASDTRQSWSPGRTVAVSGNDVLTLNDGRDGLVALRVGPGGAANDTAVTARNTALALDVLANDRVDPALGGVLTIDGFSHPANGTVTLVGGQLVYTPKREFLGTDRFDYRVRDAVNAATTASVFVTVTPNLLAPDARNDSSVALPNVATPISVLSNDAANPAVGGTLITERFTQPGHGTVTQLGADLVYTPLPDFVGSDSFTYTVLDLNGNIATAAVLVVVGFPLPTAEHDLAFAKPGGPPIIIDVLANDRADAAVGGPLTLAFAELGYLGAVRISDGKIEYTPPATIPGTQASEFFRYAIRDQNGTMVLAPQVFITLAATPPPVARPDTATTSAGTAVTINVLSNDVPDPTVGGTLTIAEVFPSVRGSVTTVVDNMVRYTPAAGLTGSDFFSYTVRDVNGITSEFYVEVTVSPPPPNRPPAAVNDTATVTAGSSNNVINVLGNDRDPEGVPPTVTAVGQPASGSATLIGGQVLYTPNAGFSGADRFTYTISDSQGHTATATVNLTVIAPPTPPPPSPPPEPPPILFKAPRHVTARSGKAPLPVTVQAVRGVRSFRVTLRATRGVFRLRVAPKIARGNKTRTLTLSGSAVAINKALRGLVLQVPGRGKARVNVAVNGGSFSQRGSIAVTA